MTACESPHLVTIVAIHGNSLFVAVDGIVDVVRRVAVVDTKNGAEVARIADVVFVFKSFSQ